MKTIDRMLVTWGLVIGVSAIQPMVLLAAEHPGKEHPGTEQTGKEHPGKEPGVVHEESHMRPEGSLMHPEGSPMEAEGGHGLLTAEEVQTLKQAEAALAKTQPDLAKKLKGLIHKLEEHHHE